ncbi:hypothetical protein RUM44_000700 [Polyplax serrata]|uniref:Uncharacterized protein n=1 Tax=Polyplax serrata TaxID=468196 RepID=A0ABR1B8F2_POLSC
MKKGKMSEKPLDNFNWLNKSPEEATHNKGEAIPMWLNSSVYKHGRSQNVTSEISSECDDGAISESMVEEDKSTISDVGSDECDCDHTKRPYKETTKGGILRHKMSRNSVVAKYIKSGMNHVASFIVESAIRFGEEHGVVVPDANAPNVYEIMAPNKSHPEKARKIRFKIPEKMLGYEDAKKVMWRSGAKCGSSGMSTGTPENDNERNYYETKSSSWSTKTDSLDEILPVLEKLEEGGEFVSSELNIEKLAKLVKSKDDDEHNRKRSRVRVRYRKRYKSADELSKATEDQDCDSNEDKPTMWKRFKRDSLDLGRQRLRAATCPRQPESMSPSLF